MVASFNNKEVFLMESLGSDVRVVPVELARALGDRGAAFLHQIHYMVSKGCGKLHKGIHWVFNTYDEWVKVFPYWSKSTIERIVQRLKAQGYLLVANLNGSKANHTNWYAINQDAIAKLGLNPQLYPQVQQTEEPKAPQSEVEAPQNEEIKTLDFISKKNKDNTYTVDDLDGQAYELLAYWNTYSVTTHSKIIPSLLQKIRIELCKALSYCSLDDIKVAIDTYTYLYHSDWYYLSFKTTLPVFLSKYLDTFLDEQCAKDTYMDTLVKDRLNQLDTKRPLKKAV